MAANSSPIMVSNAMSMSDECLPRSLSRTHPPATLSVTGSSYLLTTSRRVPKIFSSSAVHTTVAPGSMTTILRFCTSSSSLMSQNSGLTGPSPPREISAPDALASASLTDASCDGGEATDETARETGLFRLERARTSADGTGNARNRRGESESTRAGLGQFRGAEPGRGFPGREMGTVTHGAN